MLAIGVFVFPQTSVQRIFSIPSTVYFQFSSPEKRNPPAQSNLMFLSTFVLQPIGNYSPRTLTYSFDIQFEKKHSFIHSPDSTKEKKRGGETEKGTIKFLPLPLCAKLFFIPIFPFFFTQHCDTP